LLKIEGVVRSGHPEIQTHDNNNKKEEMKKIKEQ
jgi:hypothetical protein